jgi:peptidoglycan-associated lipoprotein
MLVDRLASVLREYYPEALITVEGFTDPAGSVAYNLALGQRRADEVRTHLLGQGMAPGQVRAISYGKDTSRLVRPGARGPEAGAENRRVVIVIDHPNAWTATATD